MTLPQYAWLQVQPSQSWKMFLPTKKTTATSKKRTVRQIAIGSKNQLKQVVTSFGKEPKNDSYTYPIRLIKKGNTVKAGPFVGILTTQGIRGFKGNEKNFIDIIQMGKNAGVFIFVIPAEGVDLFNKTVKAYIYNEKQQKWMIDTLPLPDVIYNRVPTRAEEEKFQVQEVLRFFHQEKIPLFNPKFFNKWTLYTWMKENQEFSTILPGTSILKEENLRQYLQQYSMLYLKPVNGKAGVGFMRIEKNEKRFYLTYQTHQITYHQTFTTIQSLWKKVKQFAKNKQYIIQQGIYLNTFHNQPYDVRVLVQKNGKDQWKVTGIGARVAGTQSITTHVPQGGMIQSIDQVFKVTFGDTKQSQQWKNKISQLVVKIAKHIELKMGHFLGEMSMDLGIDKQGHIWFFEANAKPMEFDEPSIRETSLLHLIQYFRYLSGFIPEEDEK